jgi:outer membrane lipoprotein SlyB
MSKDKNDHVVIAIFDNAYAADVAIEALKNWDKVNDDIKLGSIGTISMDGDKVKTKTGRKTGKGAKVGAVLFVASAVLTGGGTLVASAATGAVAGGVAGSFFKKSSGLTKEDIEALGAKLQGEQVAVVVACDEDEVAGTTQQLITHGGEVQSFAVPAEALDEVAQAVPEAPDAPDAPEDTASATPEPVPTA